MTAEGKPSLADLGLLIHRASRAAAVGELVFRGIFEQRPRHPDETESLRFVFSDEIEALNFVIYDLKARLDEIAGGMSVRS